MSASLASLSEISSERIGMRWMMTTRSHEDILETNQYFIYIIVLQKKIYLSIYPNPLNSVFSRKEASRILDSFTQEANEREKEKERERQRERDRG